MIVSPVHICSDKETGEPLLLNMNVSGAHAASNRCGGSVKSKEVS